MTAHTCSSLMLFTCMLLFGTALHAEEKVAAGSPGERDHCVECHGGLDGNLKKPVDEWRTSVHAAAGKRCFLCHRGNPDTGDRLAAHAKKENFIGKPNDKTVPEFCGRDGCHSIALSQFRRSPHYQAVAKTGRPNCGTCHGAHAVQHSSVGIIDETACASCHTPENTKENIAMIGDIDRGIAEIDVNIRLMEEKHADVRALRERLDNVRHMFHQLVHVFSRGEMETNRRILDVEIAGLGAESKAKVSSMQRLDALYISMLTVGLAIIAGVSIYTLIMYGRRKK